LADLRQVLEQFRLTGDLVSNVTYWRVLDPRPAEYAETPPELDPRLVDMLAAQGIRRLYTHQVLALRLILGGRSVVVVTPTASGKTLCYNLPVLNALLADRQVRALYLFPTKALAHDQLQKLEASVRDLGLIANSEPTPIAAYDGDTPSAARAQIRRTARVLLTNPDMLHVGILPNHTQWRDFFAHLRYVVIDELHQYRGIFGSHVGNVLRRLARLCRFYGCQPQFICCSATIANPVELAEKLTGEKVELVACNGAPRGERTMVFYNPPLIDRALGLRQQLLMEVRGLARVFLASGLQTVIFGRSRQAVELLLTHLRQDAVDGGGDPGAIRGYRAGYLRAERRSIEQDLRRGSARCVVATNALELGVDIGGLDVCLMAGYPGTIASTWQQAGRVGRGAAESVAFLVSSSSPLDQYIIAHPEYFFGQSPEHALINPNNLHVLLSHAACAAFELPFAPDEDYGGQDVGELMRYLAADGLVRQSRASGSWHWASDRNPTLEVSLRTADVHAVVIESCEESEDEGAVVLVPTHVIGHLDRASAPVWLYEGAIYLHDGQQYLVKKLDWEAGRARVVPVAVDYYTQASQSTRIHIETVVGEEHHENASLAHGEVLLTTRVSSYRRLRLGTQEHLGWGQVNLPEQQMLTSACWITVSESTVERLRQEGWWVGEHITARGPNWPVQRDCTRRRDNYRCRWCGAPERPGHQHDVHHIVPFREFHWLPEQNENYREANQLANLITLCPTCHRRAEQQVAVQSTLSGLGRVLRHITPLLLMCDPQDIHIMADVLAPQTGLPTLFVIDNVPAGVGLSEQVMVLYQELLTHAAELVRGCPCASGCPSCIGPTGDPDSKAKQQVLRLVAALGFTRD
jgi:DEAD/DEAH box helicase domain-containing protein